MLGLPTANAEVIANATVNQFIGSMAHVNFGVVLRWQDTNNWYKLLIDGARLAITKDVNGKQTQLAFTPFQAQSGVSYTLRFRAVGISLFAKAWPSGTTEPAGWMLTVTDASLATRQGGIRVVLQGNTQINVTAFQEAAAH